MLDCELWLWLSSNPVRTTFHLHRENEPTAKVTDVTSAVACHWQGQDSNPSSLAFVEVAAAPALTIGEGGLYASLPR